MKAALVLVVMMAMGVTMARGADAVAAGPNRTGLVMWLDAANPESVVLDADSRVREWRDLSGKGNSVSAAGEQRPSVAKGALNGKDVLRLSGKQGMRMEKAIRATKGPAMVLIVSRRSAEQASDEKWQRLVSSHGDAKVADNVGPNFCLTGDRDGNGVAYEATIYDAEQSDVLLGPIAIGRSAAADWHYFRGDIAEVLIYDRAFLSEGEFRPVMDYLQKKWGAKAGSEEQGWTRMGILENPPKHQRQDLPLSDQQNAGKWKLDPVFTDEFDGPLNTERWHLNPTAPGDWEGRQPALFSPENIYTKDGQLNLLFQIAEIPEQYKAKKYEKYTSGLIRTNGRTGYGYYECRAKPMASAGSSSFWFYSTGLPDNETEIDVFEIGGKAAGFERKYNMNAHVFRTPQEKRHWAVGGVWLSPFRFMDDYHVYGFDWNKDELAWYVDGVCVRRMKNTNWFYPMWLTFDSEAMWSWFGIVDDADLPSTFYIDYVRVWRSE